MALTTYRPIIYCKQLLRCVTLLLFIATSYSNTSAQDIHYSQFFASPFTVNPANTGFFNGDVRVGGNYRTQWSSVTVPYLTYSAYADMALLKSPISSSFIGIGLYIAQDQAGDGVLTVTRIIASGAFHHALNKHHTTYVSGGVQLGYTQKRIDFSKLYFDEQWSDNSFNLSQTPVDEIAAMKAASFSQFDINAGIMFSATLSDVTKVYTGFSMYNILRPRDSFYGDANDLGLKPVFTAGAYFTADKRLTINPSLLWQTQKSAREFMIGALCAYDMNNPTNDKIFGGMYLRAGDAFYPVVGYEYNNLRTYISYDVNYSALKPASGGYGAFELSVQYVWGIKSRQVIKYMPCPRF